MAKVAVKEAVQHTSCLNCGKLIFDKLLERCPKCGGYVAYISDEDLYLLGRHRPSSLPAPVSEED
jgi:predicted  nucleic acid-binding Zn-ribbon protein